MPVSDVIFEWSLYRITAYETRNYIIHTTKKEKQNETKQKTLLHAMLAIIFLIVFVTHFQLLLIQMPLRCVFLSEHNKSSYLPPAPPFLFSFFIVRFQINEVLEEA